MAKMIRKLVNHHSCKSRMPSSSENELRGIFSFRREEEKHALKRWFDVFCWNSQDLCRLQSQLISKIDFLRHHASSHLFQNRFKATVFRNGCCSVEVNKSNRDMHMIKISPKDLRVTATLCDTQRKNWFWYVSFNSYNVPTRLWTTCYSYLKL